jgi:hypothetical protein
VSAWSGYVWRCDVCGTHSEDAPAVLEHRDATGHMGSRIHWLPKGTRR